MHENEYSDNHILHTYATSGYLDWLRPEMTPEKRARQEEIARRMSQLMAEAYWQQLRQHKDEWWEDFNKKV